MAVVLGVDSGFVITAPTADPNGTADTLDGRSYVTKHTSPEGANAITEIGFYRSSGTNTANFEVALYSEASGIADTRLFVDATNSSSASGWITTAVNWSISANTAYWLAVQMDAHTGTSQIDYTSTGGEGFDFLSSATTLANPYGGGTVASATAMVAIYAKTSIARNVTPALGVATFAGFAPTFSSESSGGPASVTPGVGALVFNGFAPIVAASNEYQAILSRATTLGYTHPSAAQQTIQNTLLSALKSSGVWDKRDIIYILATNGDSDFATLNWKDPATFQCTKVNSPTFTTNDGYTGNGTNSYLNTNWSQSEAVQLTLSSASYFIVTKGTGNKVEFGGGDGGDNTVILFSGGYNQYRVMTAAVNTSSPGIGKFFARRDGTAISLWKNNSSFDSTTVSLTTPLSTRDTLICAYNLSGTPTEHSTTTVRLLALGSALNDTEKTAEYDAITTYLNAIDAVTPDVGVATFTGFAPTVSAVGGGGVSVTPGVGVAVFNGFAPTLPKAIPCVAGVYTITGNTAGLQFNRKIPINTGSYAVTGNTVDLRKGVSMVGTAGVYTITGNAVALRKTYRLVCTAGVYTVTGNTVALKRSRIMPIVTGVYTITGNAVILRKGLSMACTAGVYAITGNTVVLRRTRIMPIVTGVYTITGNTAALKRSRIMPIVTGAHTLNGNTLDLRKGRAMVCTAGVYTITGNTVTISRGRVVVLESGVYTLTGNSVALVIPNRLQPVAGVYTFTGNPVTLLYNPIGGGGGTVIRGPELAQGGDYYHIILNASASATSNVYRHAVVVITGGTGVGQSALITAYNGSTKKARRYSVWATPPDETSLYVIVPFDSGFTIRAAELAQGAGKDYIFLNSAASAINNTYTSALLVVTSGPGQDQSFRVQGYNGTSKKANIAGVWNDIPSSASTYMLLPNNLVK